MTTEQIRKSITVTDFNLSETGICIKYTTTPSDDATRFEKTLSMPPLQSIIELEKIGSINKFEGNPYIRIFWDSPKGTPLDAYWEQFCTVFTLCQYEAITLVVRHEYEKHLLSDINLLELDKALEALK